MIRLLHEYSIPHMLESLVAQTPLKSIVFTEEYPTQEVKAPTIAWKIATRVPGAEGKETRKPRYRGADIPITGAPQTSYYGQRMTVIYQFDLFHATNAEVNKLQLDFEQFLMEARPSLCEAGVEHFIFEEQLMDSLVKVPERTVARHLRYRAQYTEYIPVLESRINDLLISVREDLDWDIKPIIRGPDIDDVIPVDYNFSGIMGIFDTPDYTVASPSYRDGLDYAVVINTTTTTIAPTIMWLNGGKHPAYGSTYYILFTKWTSSMDTSTGKQTSYDRS